MSSTNSADPVFVTIDQTRFEDDGTGTIWAHEIVCKFEDRGLARVPESVMRGLAHDNGPGSDDDDHIWTMVHVAKRSEMLLDVTGAVETVRVRSYFEHYVPNYVE